MTLGVKLFGKWADAVRITESMADRFAKAAKQALMKEAHLLRGNIVKNLTSGGQHAGRPFAPLSEMTLIVRQFRGFGGTKPLIVTGALLGAVSVVQLGASAVFVGIRRAAGGKGGANLAALHEFGGGPWTRPMTDKQRRFLAAALRSAGKSFGEVAGGGGVLKIRIPARPYVGPVVDKFHQPKQVRDRFWGHIAKAMNGDLGR